MSRACLLVLAFGLTAGSGCTPNVQTPTSPSSAEPTITPQVSALKVGETQSLALTVDGTALSGVAWTSDHPELCSVSSAAIATALRPGTLTISAVASGNRRASLAVKIVPAMDGSWVGQGILVSYRRISGGGPYPAPTPTPYPYSMRLTQIHDQLAGNDSRNQSLENYQGTVDIAGNVSLSGSVDLPEVGQLHIDTQTWTARTDTNPDRLNGSYTDIVRFPNFFGQQVIEYVSEFKDLVRQP